MSLDDYETKYVEEMKPAEMGAVMDTAVLSKTSNTSKILSIKTERLQVQVKVTYF